MKIQRVDNLNTFGNKKELSDSCPIFYNNSIQQKNNNNKSNLTPSISDLRRLVLLKFDSISAFSRKLGLSRSFGTKILNGSYIPTTSKTIKKIAKVLDFDPVILAQVFQREQEYQNYLKECKTNESS